MTNTSISYSIISKLTQSLQYIIVLEILTVYFFSNLLFLFATQAIQRKIVENQFHLSIFLATFTFGQAIMRYCLFY
jgi:hypothetical protein